MNAPPRLLLAGCLLASFPLLACSAAPDGRTDSPTPQQSSPSTSPAAPSSSPSLPASTGTCAATLGDYCATTSCLTTWSAADDVCMTANPGTVRFSTTCGDDYVLVQATTTSYYEASTGGLLAVVDASGNCLAGPSDFVAPAASSCPLIDCGMQSCGTFDGGMP